jgi:hypothetical protein
MRRLAVMGIVAVVSELAEIASTRANHRERSIIFCELSP